MKRSIFTASLFSLSALIAAPQAVADNIANCEIILMETIEDESGNGSVQVASYRPAADFIASVYSADDAVINDIDGLAIRALLCSRRDVIISDTDFKILATGVPFVLSQNFDSSNSDLLTYFFKAGQFQYTHKGEALSEDKLEVLTARMADFNAREDAIENLVGARKAKKATSETDVYGEDGKDETGKPANDEDSDNKPDDVPTITPELEEAEAEGIPLEDSSLGETDLEALPVEDKIQNIEAAIQTKNAELGGIEVHPATGDVQKDIQDISTPIIAAPLAEITANKTEPDVTEVAVTEVAVPYTPILDRPDSEIKKPDENIADIDTTLD